MGHLDRNSFIYSFIYSIIKVLAATSMRNLLETLKDCTKMLDLIMKGLNAYLETKRLFFYR